MPQLDFFVVLGSYVVFILFLRGFLAFQLWLLPHSISLSKLSNRSYFYYSSLLAARHVCEYLIDVSSFTIYCIYVGQMASLTSGATPLYYDDYAPK
jgi:hypothetical protein